MEWNLEQGSRTMALGFYLCKDVASGSIHKARGTAWQPVAYDG